MQLSKFHNKHILSLTGNGIISIFGIATIAVLAHFLTRQDLGEWFIFLTIISVCDAVRNGFLNTATIKFYAGEAPDRAANVLGSVWFLAILLTGAALAINALGFGLKDYLGHNAEIHLKWVGLTFLSSLPYSVMFWKMQADEEYSKMIWLRLLNNGSTIVAFVVLIALHKLTLETTMLYNFLTNCLTSAVGILWGQARLRTIFRRSGETVKALANFGKYSLATTFSATLLRTTDTFVIGSMLSAAAVAYYTLPGRLLETVELPLRSFAATGMSTMAAAFNKKDMGHVSYIFKKYSGMLTISIIPQCVFVFLFADFIINTLYGHQYALTPTANIYRIFIVVCLLFPIDRFNGITLDIIHKPHLNLYKVLIMLVVNLTVDVTGVYLFKSVYAVVFAGFITSFAALAFGYYHLRKYVDYSIPGILKEGFSEIKLLALKMLKTAGVK